VPSLDHLAAIFTIAAGSLALIQLTAILLRVNRRPRLSVQLGLTRRGTEAGSQVIQIPLITTNTGSLSARNILWNYDLPVGFLVLGSDEHHTRADRVTVARALEYLHPRVETHHELTIRVPENVNEFELRYRIHMEDARPQTGTVQVKVPAATREPQN
jgi:hypothetical protein